MMDESERDVKDARAYVDKEFIESPLAPENETYADIAERAFLAGRKRDEQPDNEKLIAEARRASSAVYLATDAEVASDLSRILRSLADELEKAHTPTDTEGEQ